MNISNNSLLSTDGTIENGHSITTCTYNKVYSFNRGCLYDSDWVQVLIQRVYMVVSQGGSG